MKVIYGVDPAYLLPALISIHSLWRHTSRVADVAIYGEGFGSEERELVHRFENAWKRSISIRDFDVQIHDEIRQVNKSRFPLISLLPLFLPNLEEGRCLFMDADTLFVGDAQELWSSDLSGMPIGACNDVYVLRMLEEVILGVRAFDVLRLSSAKAERRRRTNWLMEQTQRVGVLPRDYFNSGVILMDCNMIRSAGVGDELADMVGLRPHLEGGLPDQDRMNEVFAERWFRLPIKWNTTPRIRTAAKRIQPGWSDDGIWAQISEAAETPMIWHHHGPRKPWMRMSWARRLQLAKQKAFVDYRAAAMDFSSRTGITVY